jgi:hypothetical protein
MADFGPLARGGVLANGVLDVRGYARQGAGGDRNSPEWGCYIVDRWRGRFFFTCLTLIYTGLCTTATNDIPCVQDSVWRHLGWTANFNKDLFHLKSLGWPEDLKFYGRSDQGLAQDGETQDFPRFNLEP